MTTSSNFVVEYEQRFPYYSQGGTLRPLIPVRLTYQGSSIDLLALVDTGADFSMFPSTVASALGIELDNLPRIETAGTAGMVDTWLHYVELTVVDKVFNCRVGFVDNPQLPPLLGREPVFSGVQFGFQQSRWEFYFSSNP